MAVVTVVAALAPVLKITAWAEADTKVISWPPDSEAIASIALCTNAGKEVVLLPESIECADYRSGYRLHRTKFPDMPMKIDWAPVCSYAKDQPQDFRRLSGDTIKRIVNLTKSSRDPHGIRIIGAVFCDTLDLAGLDLDHTLVIDRSLFYRGLDIRNFRTRGDLSFDGSLALDETSIRRSSIGGSVYAADAYIQRLQILDSEIKGSLLFHDFRLPACRHRLAFKRIQRTELKLLLLFASA
jgi:hypothetical protein